MPVAINDTEVSQEAFELDFITLDVFTTSRYEGNPLALVKVPEHLEKRLTQAKKQKIASEFNLSETCFLHERRGTDEWVLDIFTDTDELPFAGHPTIGAGCYVLNMDSKKSATIGALITKAGNIEISQRPGGGVTAEIPHNLHIHRHTISDLVHPSVGLSVNTVLSDAEKTAPLVSIVKGMTFLLVRLPSIELLAEAHSTSRHLSFFQMLDKGWEEGFVARYYYVLECDDLEAEDVVNIRTRMMESTLEDPATGSAACALSSYLALHGVGVGSGKTGRYNIIQGVEMGRKSTIGVEVTLQDNGTQIEYVKLSGNAVKVMQGRLRV